MSAADQVEAFCVWSVVALLLVAVGWFGLALLQLHQVVASNMGGGL